MLIASYFAECTPSSMNCIVLRKGKDFKGWAERLTEKALAGALAACTVPLTTSTAAVCTAAG